MTVLETPRLTLRQVSLDDAEFIFELVSEPGWIRYIGDKRLKTLDDARRYIRDAILASYDRLGFGLYLTALRDTGAPIGLCGPLKRDTLEDVDIGYALLSAHTGHGYAIEAVSAVVAHARDALGLTRVVAITTPDNARSIRVLEKAGFAFERELPAPESDAPLFLFGSSLQPEAASRRPIVLAPGAGRHYPMGRIGAIFKADGPETSQAYSISEWWLEANTKGPGAHSHPEDDVFFVIEGTMSLLVGDTWHDAPVGSFVLVPGGTTHDFENRSDRRAGVLNFSPDPFEEAMPGIAEWFREHPPEDAR